MNVGRGIFVTGGSGFIGSRLVAVLAAGSRPIYALDRSGRLAASAPGGNLHSVPGTIEEPDGYRRALENCDAVLHLAAATGRAAPAEHDRTNARGTEILIDQCRRAGVTRLIFVSSIAARFEQVDDYPYALSKRAAESAVERSGLDYLIVRPTIVLGAGAPILGSLERLACLPVGLVPGSGTARVQPIHVDDLTAFLVEQAGRAVLGRAICEIGGESVLSMEELLRAVRRSRRGSTGPFLHVPLAMLSWPLKAAETIGLGGSLPLRPGQLSSFREDGTVKTRCEAIPFRPQRALADMLGSEPARADSPLHRECELFCRYLSDLGPTPYITRKYLEGHDRLPGLMPVNRFDSWLLRFAGRGAVFVRLADAYATVFAPASALRRKLVLVLALLEVSYPHSNTIDAPLYRSRMRLVFGLALDGLLAAAAFLLGALLLVPARAVFAILPERRP